MVKANSTLNYCIYLYLMSGLTYIMKIFWEQTDLAICNWSWLALRSAPWYAGGRSSWLLFFLPRSHTSIVTNLSLSSISTSRNVLHHLLWILKRCRARRRPNLSIASCLLWAWAAAIAITSLQSVGPDMVSPDLKTERYACRIPAIPCASAVGPIWKQWLITPPYLARNPRTGNFWSWPYIEQ